MALSRPSVVSTEASASAETPAPVARAVDASLRRAIIAGASDLHIEPASDGAGRTRLRVDGVMRAAEPISRELFAPLTSRIKLLAGMDIANRRLPQDGRYSVVVDGRRVDARVSSIPNVNVGVQLRVTPTIGDDGGITAEFHPEYSEIIGFNASFPIIANRKVDATLRVRDGETIVLGGLFQDTSSETISKLPFLGDIPILGQFFKNKATARQRDEVVFLITPHILPPDP
jgi:Bacterial type II and III secretion system protein/Type II/IV secretion system protein